MRQFETLKKQIEYLWILSPEMSHIFDDRIHTFENTYVKMCALFFETRPVIRSLLTRKEPELNSAADKHTS